MFRVLYDIQRNLLSDYRNLKNQTFKRDQDQSCKLAFISKQILFRAIGLNKNHLRTEKRYKHQTNQVFPQGLQHYCIFLEQEKRENKNVKNKNKIKRAVKKKNIQPSKMLCKIVVGDPDRKILTELQNQKMGCIY